MAMTDQTGAASRAELPAQLPVVRLAAAGFLARYEGGTRRAYDLDLRTWFAWCSRHGVDPLAVTRPMVELYMRWMTETAGYAPATTAQRLGTVCRFYRFLVTDGMRESGAGCCQLRGQAPRRSWSPARCRLALRLFGTEAPLGGGRRAGSASRRQIRDIATTLASTWAPADSTAMLSHTLPPTYMPR